jgi:PEP-CTERM motif
LLKKLLLALVFTLAVGLPLSAREITFTFSGTGSGVMKPNDGLNPFTTFQIIGIADTSNVQIINGVYSLNLPVSTFRGSGDAYPFSNIMRVFAADDVFGFGLNPDWERDLLAPHSPTFVGYNLATNMPATTSSDIGLIEYFQWIGAEEGGAVIFDSVSSVTVSAELSSGSDSQVPEPGSIALFATGLLGLGVLGRKHFVLS